MNVYNPAVCLKRCRVTLIIHAERNEFKLKPAKREEVHFIESYMPIRNECSEYAVHSDAFEKLPFEVAERVVEYLVGNALALVKLVHMRSHKNENEKVNGVFALVAFLCRFCGFKGDLVLHPFSTSLM